MPFWPRVAQGGCENSLDLGHNAPQDDSSDSDRARLYALLISTREELNAPIETNRGVKMKATIEDFADEIDPHFVERIRKIFPSDEAVVEWLNRPFMGLNREKTNWERLIDERTFKGYVLDMTCNYPILRSDLSILQSR